MNIKNTIAKGHIKNDNPKMSLRDRIDIAEHNYSVAVNNPVNFPGQNFPAREQTHYLREVIELRIQKIIRDHCERIDY